MNEHKKIIIDINVRFKDIDSMNHVNNAVYFTYFEEGRKEFVQSVFGIVDPEDYNFIIAHISCDYLKPVKISDEVFLEIWVGDIGRKHFEFIYRLIGKNMNNKSEVYAKGKSVQVFFDYVKNAVIPIPEHIIKKISEFSYGQMEK
jgi:acyl-CoA thioester hydrolase